jgi:hypothetical protein
VEKDTMSSAKDAAEYVNAKVQAAHRAAARIE